MRSSHAKQSLFSFLLLLFFLLFSGELDTCHCQTLPPSPTLPADQELQRVQNELTSLTDSITTSLAQKFSFCISDPEKDWMETFGYVTNPIFLSDCLQENEDLASRLCTEGEINFYFTNLYEDGELSKFMKPNVNCNLTSWVLGCDSGWACSMLQSQSLNGMNSSYSEMIPDRTDSCKPCCEGFFCPHGLTCMIPCPLGAYCPVGNTNTSTGGCNPYGYQIPPHTNSKCGAADMWADVSNTETIFCPAGYYCPNTIEKINCSHGHYCRMGSISEKKCFRKSFCHTNTENENIASVGIFLMGILSVLLLVIYNCSGLFLSFRERRKAKSRETAAKMAKETMQTHEKWRAAKEIAKKHVSEFSNQLSHTFSRRMSFRPVEKQKPKILGESPEDPLMRLGKSRELSSDLSTSKNNNEMNNRSRDLYNTIFPLEDEESNDESNEIKESVTKGKHRKTRTQIFIQAYGEIEKEKVFQQENNNLTFSTVFNMDTKERPIRQRPLLEVAFKDLTLTLGKKRKLLRSITGKLIPGRVTAVMGPSGAGKTTFLNAVAGKVSGYKVSGMVLVNGKVGNIRSYKKIIGFVPQDDIVHGNLTVEENLWFSASCRLSANMSHANKILVVERVIESLGLQGVRSSLVGTVEKRGISGGQRKRVNVGLEMVMEPSLLILDEPTSGLDSSSSQLLLRALRREALEGVNICAVIHQPSYTLYKMFDDLILLAKGGLTVYHGSINKVEEYFSSLGMSVPDRVNPPDYFIDILEGVIKPNTDINIKHLPLQWILHNGYEVPQDMQADLAEMDVSSRGHSEQSSARSSQQFEQDEVWGNVKYALRQERNHLKKSNDLSNRKTPGILKQYKYYLGRVTKQRLRDAKVQAIDFLILGLAGTCLGIIARLHDNNFGVPGYIYTIIAISLLCKIAALRSFSLDRLEYMRERESGMSSLAYFLSKDTIDHFNTIVKPAVYLPMFYYFNNPRSSFVDNYIVMIALVYCVTGVGYTFAICFQPGSAQLWSALLPVVLTLLSTQSSTPLVIANLCYPKWALEAFLIANAKRYSGVWLITRCAILLKSRSNINHWGLCITVLFLYGLLFRIIAFVCMVLLQKR